MSSQRTKRKKPQATVRRVARGDQSARSRNVNPRRGASVGQFLREEGIYESASTQAIKEVLVWQIQQTMERRGISKAEMARLMGTSRSALDRLLDAGNESLTLGTLFRAAGALDCELRVELREKVAS